MRLLKIYKIQYLKHLFFFFFLLKYNKLNLIKEARLKGRNSEMLAGAQPHVLAVAHRPEEPERRKALDVC